MKRKAVDRQDWLDLRVLLLVGAGFLAGLGLLLFLIATDV
jgi:hypothetical protein